jgi:hypothetical protein
LIKKKKSPVKWAGYWSSIKYDLGNDNC